MAEVKKVEADKVATADRVGSPSAADVAKAPGPLAAEGSDTTLPQQTKSSGLDVESADGTKTYYLRPGKEHQVIVKGERKNLSKTGDEAQLSEAQYTSFRDKFWTKPELDAWKAGEEILATGASAAEFATINDRNAAQAALDGNVADEVAAADEAANKAAEDDGKK